MSSTKIPVGQYFQKTLTTHSGTGYTWVLTSLPPGLALTEITTATIGKQIMPGGPLSETFTFLGIAKGAGKLSFSLIRPWEPTEAIDTLTLEVEVVELEKAAEAVAGHDTFLPLVSVACEGEHEGKIVLQSAANCQLKYGYFPGHHGCILKYGIPVRTLYGYPPPDDHGPIIARYMAQPPLSQK